MSDDRADQVLAALGLGEERAAFLALPVGDQVRELERRVRGLGEAGLRPLLRLCAGELARPFLPFPGPQAAALLSPADVLLYGGAAGGGKSHLLVGAAGEHRRAAIFRREGTELDGLVAVVQDLYGRDDYNKVEREHSGAGRSLKLGGMKDPDDWRHFAGRARDLIGYDEAGEFLEMQVRALLAWLRSPDAGQRCRMILASNPPRSADGEWLVRWFAPWIDPGFPEPAAPGELRWAIFAGDELRWVGGPAAVEIDGDAYTPLSFTFIPAKLGDNPFQDQAAYRARLSNLPEPLRSQLIHGNFLAGREDDAWQVIPSEWITAAQARWKPEPPDGVPMTAIGADVAQGGPDRTVLAPRHGTWFAPPVVAKGIDTKNGPAVAGLVFGALRDGCTVVVDMGGGWGGSAFDHLRQQLPEDAVVGFVGAGASQAKSANGLEGFANKRAEVWWRFREALDPETGAGIALPPDPALAAELAVPRRKPEARQIQVEAKEEIRKRLGRSPDLGDAVVMAWAYGDARAAERLHPARRQQQANLGYAQVKLHAIQGGRSGSALPNRANTGLQRRWA